MQDLIVSISDIYETPDSDIVLKIDFIEGEGSASRPFRIAADLIKALEEIDHALIKSVDTRIRTALIVEDLQKSSIKVFLKNVLGHVDDDALKELEWKKIVGSFLVKGKYAAIRWLDSDKPQIADLTNDVADLADEASEVHHLPLPAPPNVTRLAQAMDRWQDAKASFKSGESLTITLDKSDYQVNLARQWKPSENIEDVPGDRELVSDHQTILMIRKPDMLGKSAWQFRLGKANISVPIEDSEWLDRYKLREFSLLPGDALQVSLRTESTFTEKGELIDTKQRISKVIRVIPQDPPATGDLLGDQNSPRE